jgi:hypothetical protein
MADETEKGDFLPPGCGFWLGWLAASVLGMLLGWIIGWRASFLVPGGISTIVLGLIVGLILGFMQWLVLRNHLMRPGWWIIASALGWSAGFSIGAAVAQLLGFSEIFFGMVVGFIIGAFLGILQWLILRQKVLSAGWWVPASILAWTSSLLYYRPGISGAGAYYGILSGLVTGTVLLWLLYRPEP